MSVQQASPQPQKIIIQTERAPPVVKVPRPEKIDIDAILVPGFLIASFVGVAFYREEIVSFIDDVVTKLGSKDLKDLVDKIMHPDVEPLPPIFPGGGLGGSVIFDSNRDWVGKAGQTVTKFGNTGPNGKGFYTSASGDPKVRFVTATEYELIGSGSGIHPRIYGAVNNYNARLEFQFKFNSSSIDNISFKIRNRHQMGGGCENRVGGFGAHIARNEGGLKIEKCHNIQEDGVEKPLGQNISNGQWYTAALTVVDTAQGILQTVELNGKEIARDVYTGNYAPYRNKASFDKQSEFWLRYNGGSGSVSFKNIRITSLSSSANFARANIGYASPSSLPADYLMQYYNSYYPYPYLRKYDKSTRRLLEQRVTIA